MDCKPWKKKEKTLCVSHIFGWLASHEGKNVCKADLYYRRQSYVEVDVCNI